MPHNPASIVRLLYGERAQKRNRAAGFLFNPANNSLTSAPPIGQGHRLLGTDLIQCCYAERLSFE